MLGRSIRSQYQQLYIKCVADTLQKQTAVTAALAAINLLTDPTSVAADAATLAIAGESLLVRIESRVSPLIILFE